MKKFLTGFLAAGAALALSTSAFAATTKVTVTSTQTSIVKEACNYTGSLSFNFEKNTVLKIGDKFTVTLPNGVTLCKDIDLVLGQNATEAQKVTFKKDTGTPANNTENSGLVDTAGTDAPGLIGDTVNVGTGPVSFFSYNGSGVADGDTDVLANAGRPFFWITGANGGSVVTIMVLAKDDGVAPAEAKGNPIINVGQHDGDRLTLTLFDGQLYDTTETRAIMKKTEATTTTGKVFSGLITTAKGYSFPTPFTSMCVKAASSFPGTQVDVAYNSFDATDNTPKFDFSPTYKIAVFGSSFATEVVSCAKDAGYIKVLSGTAQANKNCSFDFENLTGYCTTSGYINKALIKATTGVWTTTASDKFGVELESLTDGVYFSGTAPVVAGYAQAEDECYEDGTPKITADISNYDTYVKGSATPQATQKFPTSNCTIADDAKVMKLVLKDTAAVQNFFKDAATPFDIVRVNIPTMYYNLATVGNNVEAKVKITIRKMPCGELSSQTIKLGTFVTDCNSLPGGGTGTTTGSTTLMYPFFPSMTGDDDDAGWWAGIVITNGTATAGEATLTFNDKDGKTATIKKNIPANGQYVAGLGSTIKVADLTAGTPAFDGKKKYSVQVSCPFNKGAGFAFLGGPAGVGDGAYKAYVLNGNSWQ